MNAFPTRILLASDGSESAAHATEVAVELSKKTHSELHVLYVGEYSPALLYPQAADTSWVVQEDLAPLKRSGGSSSNRWLVAAAPRSVGAIALGVSH